MVCTSDLLQNHMFMAALSRLIQYLSVFLPYCINLLSHVSILLQTLLHLYFNNFNTCTYVNCVVVIFKYLKLMCSVFWLYFSVRHLCEFLLYLYFSNLYLHELCCGYISIPDTYVNFPVIVLLSHLFELVVYLITLINTCVNFAVVIVFMPGT